MKSSIGWGLVLIGVLILLLGFATPSTTTQTATTCYNDPMGYGQDCVRTSYEAPNTGKGGIIGLGIFIAIIGGFLSQSDSPTPQTIHNQSPSQKRTQTLGDQIRERQSEKEDVEHSNESEREH